MEQVYGPLNKDKMTKKTNEPSGWNPVFEFLLDEPNTIIIDGVKYKRIEEQQSFYDKLWELLKTKLDDSVECDYMADQVTDLIRQYIPRRMENKLMSEYICGYNQVIDAINRRLFSGIQ